MCGDAIGNAIEWTGNQVQRFPLLPSAVSSVPIIGTIPGALLAAAGLFSDATTIDRDDFNHTNVDVTGLPEDYKRKSMNVFGGSFTTDTFKAALEYIFDDAKNVTGANDEKWANISNALNRIVLTYRNSLGEATSDESGDTFTGQTAEAAKKNIEASFQQLEALSKGAAAMAVLSPAFSTAIRAIIENVNDRRDDYNSDLKWWPEKAAEINNEYNQLAQSVMADYAKNIATISSNNPDMSGGETPKGPGGADPGTQAPGSGNPSGTGSPTSPSADKPQTTTPTKKTTNNPNTNTKSTPSMPQMPNVSDALSGLTDAAKDAAGTAADAVKQALDSALGAPTDAAVPPEGVLGLGPTGLGAMGAKAGGAGRGGGGPGARPASTSLPKSASTPTSASTRSAGAVTQAARAGLSSGSGAGAPGAGAPAAGQRGGGADGTVHKANKALRRKKNGEEVMGATEAAVPVVGSDGQTPVPASGASPDK